MTKNSLIVLFPTWKKQLAILKVKKFTLKPNHPIIEPHSEAASPSIQEADFELCDLITCHNTVLRIPFRIQIVKNSYELKISPQE